MQNLRQNGRSFTVGSTTRASNFFKTADGRTIYLLRNTGRQSITTDLVGMLRCENTTESLSAAVAKWKASDLEEALAERKLPGVVVRKPEEWLQHPQGEWLADRPGVEIEKIGDSAAQPFAPGERPMSGVRVLDASHVIAGPATGRMLAEHGADVLHVTTPKEQEHVHVMMDTGLGKRAAYIDLNEVADVGATARIGKEGRHLHTVLAAGSDSHARAFRHATSPQSGPASSTFRSAVTVTKGPGLHAVATSPSARWQPDCPPPKAHSRIRRTRPPSP